MSDRIDSPRLPPPLFVADTVKFTMMCGAEGHNPLVTDLAP